MNPQAPYDRLADLARDTWMPALICSSGQTSRRLDELPLWTRSLQDGRLPPPDADFGDPQACAALRLAIAELDLCTLTHASEPMTRQVLHSVLWHLDRLIDRADGSPRAAAIERMARAFRTDWDQQREGWEEVLALLSSLGDLAHLRWDELQGRLSRREWAEARRIGALLLHLRELVRFIDQVGRSEPVAQADSASLPLPRPDTSPRPLAMTLTTHRADQPGEVRGVRRSAQIARMLASEAAMVRHPQLRRLWRARLAEQQLLTYEDEAILSQWHLQPDAIRPLRAEPRPEKLARGPLIVCLDTSGSMRGPPENIAKACVLQALRSAHAARRPCVLLAFGGQGELLERELSLSVAGLDAVLDLMGQGFDGGTDVQTPLERAVALVREPAHAQADILIVSDGEFGATPATLAMLREAREQLGLRVYGVLIGDRETIGLLEVSDRIHWVRDWRRYASESGDAYADGFSPVHSQSLTALYFPNAIRR